MAYLLVKQSFFLASYIVVRHLPEDYRSILSIVLQRHSPLWVVEAAGGLAVNENKRQAITVTLFDDGTDGIEGAVAIKKAGGLVIV